MVIVLVYGRQNEFCGREVLYGQTYARSIVLCFTIILQSLTDYYDYTERVVMFWGLSPIYILLTSFGVRFISTPEIYRSKTRTYIETNPVKNQSYILHPPSIYM